MLSFFSNTFVKELALIIYLKLHTLFVLLRRDKAGLDVHAFMSVCVCVCVCVGVPYATHVAQLKSLVKL